MKTLAILFISLFTTITAVIAQDIIVKKNGDIIEGKVIEVGVDRVTYKIDKSENSANFVILKRDLNRIEFENGQTVWLTERQARTKSRPEIRIEDQNLGRHIVTISPFKALDSGPGFGISYELQLGKHKNFGIILPFTLTLPDATPNLYDFGGDSRVLYYVAPGLKIYPFGQRKVTYALGPQFFYGRGEDWNYSYNYDPVTGIYREVRNGSTRTRAGLIINNYLQFQVTPRFMIGLNAGLGPRYINREKTEFNTIDAGRMQLTGEFSFSLGVRL